MMGTEEGEVTPVRDEIQDLYFWLGEEAERVGFTPWVTGWLGYSDDNGRSDRDLARGCRP
jgi:hypothetical protein